MSLGIDLTKREFKLFQDFIYTEVGITLADHKITLLKSRLSARLRKLEMKSFKDYLEYLQNDTSGEEMMMFINAISTNVTSFFREAGQWDFLEDELKKISEKKGNRKLRIWSSASSSGEEPYSIAIFLKDHLKDFYSWDIKILATDISQDILQKASNGKYEAQKVGAMPKYLKIKNFNFNKIENTYTVKDEIKNLITFKAFNLVTGNYEMFQKIQFDIVFCRNVMIYFDNTTRASVVANLSSTLVDNGLFFIGHSESLMNNKSNLKNIGPAIYRKTN